MTKIRFHGDWTSDEKLTNDLGRRHTKDGNTWNNLELSTDEYDYLVIFNKPKNENFDKKKAIIFQGEPDAIRRSWGKYYKPDPDEFFYVFDTDNHYNCCGWHMKKSYQDLLKPIQKTALLSGIVSAKSSFQGQRDRLEFVKVLDKIGYETGGERFSIYDHYGRGNFNHLQTYRGALDDKADGLFPYKYHFNAENHSEKNYFTEKLTDAIVSECLCFYWGCPNMSDFIDERAFIWIDINDHKKSVETIINAINNNEWEKRLPFIKKAKEKIMNELQMMPTIERIINERK